MDKLNLIYLLKQGFGPSDRYLGANVEHLQFYNGLIVWSTECVDYLKSATQRVNNPLGEYKAVLKNYFNGYRLYSSSYRTELDITE